MRKWAQIEDSDIAFARAQQVAIDRVTRMPNVELLFGTELVAIRGEANVSSVELRTNGSTREQELAAEPRRPIVQGVIDIVDRAATNYPPVGSDIRAKNLRSGLFG